MCSTWSCWIRNITWEASQCPDSELSDYSLTKKSSPRALDKCSTFVHCRAILQLVIDSRRTSQGNRRHLNSECLKSSRAQKPIQQKENLSRLELGVKPPKITYSTTELDSGYSIDKKLWFIKLNWKKENCKPENMLRRVVTARQHWCWFQQWRYDFRTLMKCVCKVLIYHPPKFQLSSMIWYCCSLAGTNFTGSPFHAYRLHKAWSGLYKISLPTKWSFPPLSSSHTSLKIFFQWLEILHTELKPIKSISQIKINSEWIYSHLSKFSSQKIQSESEAIDFNLFDGFNWF